MALRKKVTSFLSISAIFFSAVITSGAYANNADRTDPYQTLFFAAAGEPTGLDPVLNDEIESGVVMCNIYESLLTMRKDDVQVEPCLAESWEISDDLTTYTFMLRKNVLFHDGTPFNAAAVKVNYDRQTGKNYSQISSKSKIVFDIVDRLEIVDDYTVRFVLKHPSSPFIYNIARNFAAPIASPAALDKYNNDLTQNPVGTGPYKFVKWDTGKKILLERNDDYWGEKPAIRYVNYSIMKETFSRVFALANGEVDAVNGIDVTVMDDLKNWNIPVTEKIGNNINYMAFNFAEGSATADPEVRAAIASSINIPELVHYLYQTHAEPAYSFLPSLILGFDRKLRYSHYRPGEARDTFLKKGIKSLKIITYSDSRSYNPLGGFALADTVQFYLKEAGVETVIETYNWSEYKKRLISDSWDIAFTGWLGDTGGGVNFFTPLYSQNPAVNIGKWHNPEFIETVKAAEKIPVGPERTALLTKADHIVAADLAILPISHCKAMVAHSKYISGEYLHPVGFLYFKRAVKDPAADVSMQGFSLIN